MTTTNKDYYGVLGVCRDASDDDIRRAFRKLAMQYHPDRNKSPDAEERFKEINEANQVLSDSIKRREYDSFKIVTMIMLVWNKYQIKPAAIYGNIHFGEGSFAIRICQNPTVDLANLGADKAMIYHWNPGWL